MNGDTECLGLLDEYDIIFEELGDALRADWYATYEEYYEDEWPENM